MDVLAAEPPGQQALLTDAGPLRGMTWSRNGSEPVAGSGTPDASLRRESPTPPATTTPPGPAARRDDIAARLRRLDDLRAQGLVSEAEYREQRRRILDEL